MRSLLPRRFLASFLAIIALGFTPAPAAELTPAAKRKIQALTLVYGEAAAAKPGSVERGKLLEEFLARSGEFVRDQPGVGAVWVQRATVALELGRAREGWEAGRAMIRLGLENSSDAAVQQLLVQLERKNWLGEKPPAGASAAPAVAEAGKPFTIPDLDLALVPVSAGRFTMGSPVTELGRGAEEGPQTEVTITKAFWLGKTEVRVRDFRAFVDASGYQTEAEKGGGLHAANEGKVVQKAGSSWKNPSLQQTDEHPVIGVTWNDAVAYCRWLTAREKAAGRLPDGFAYSLPTEAQWEYACRAGSAEVPVGKLDAIAWYGNNSGKSTHAVGQKQANPWGLYDMTGNAWEWCLDWYSDKLPGGKTTDPKGVSAGPGRVLRGGGWGNDPAQCRFASRVGVSPAGRFDFLGFRVALSVAP